MQGGSRIAVVEVRAKRLEVLQAHEDEPEHVADRVAEHQVLITVLPPYDPFISSLE